MNIPFLAAEWIFLFRNIILVMCIPRVALLAFCRHLVLVEAEAHKFDDERVGGAALTCAAPWNILQRMHRSWW